MEECNTSDTSSISSYDDDDDNDNNDGDNNDYDDEDEEEYKLNIYDFAVCVIEDHDRLDRLLKTPKIHLDNIEKEIDILKKKERIMLHVAFGNLEKIQDYTIEDFNMCYTIAREPIYFIAARYGHVHILEYFSYIGIVFDKRDCCGNTILNVVALNNRLDVMKFLDKNCPKLVYNLCINSTFYRNLIDNYEYENKLYDPFFFYIHKKPYRIFRKITYEYKKYTWSTQYKKFMTPVFDEKKNSFLKEKTEKYCTTPHNRIDEQCVMCCKNIEMDKYMRCEIGDVCHYNCFIPDKDKISYDECFIKKTFKFKCKLCDSRFKKAIDQQYIII